MKKVNPFIFGLMAFPTLMVLEAKAGFLSAEQLGVILHAPAGTPSALIRVGRVEANGSIPAYDAEATLVGIPNSCRDKIRVEGAPNVSRNALRIMAADGFERCVASKWRAVRGHPEGRWIEERSDATNRLETAPIHIDANSEESVGFAVTDAEGAALNPSARIQGSNFIAHRDELARERAIRARIAECARNPNNSAAGTLAVFDSLPAELRAGAIAAFARDFNLETRRLVAAIESDIAGADASKLREIKGRLLALLGRLRSSQSIAGIDGMTALNSELSNVFELAASRAGNIGTGESSTRDGALALGIEILNMGIDSLGDGARTTLLQRRDSLLITRLEGARDDSSRLEALAGPMNDLLGRLRDRRSADCVRNLRPAVCTASTDRLNRVLDIAGLPAAEDLAPRAAAAPSRAVVVADPVAVAPSAPQVVKPTVAAQIQQSAQQPSQAGAFQTPFQRSPIFRQVGGFQFPGGVASQFGAGTQLFNNQPGMIQPQQFGSAPQQGLVFPQQQQQMVYPQQQVMMAPRPQVMVGNPGQMPTTGNVALLPPSMSSFQPVWVDPRTTAGMVGAMAGMRATSGANGGGLGLGISAHLNAGAFFRI